MSSTSPYLSPQHLHAVATRKCLALLPKVVRIIKHCLNHSPNSVRSGLFVWDSGLVRDGCFFAGYLAACVEEDILNHSHDDQPMERGDQDPTTAPLSTDEAVMVCLSALSAMRWAYSKSEGRRETIRDLWQSRRAKCPSQSAHYTASDIPYPATYLPATDHGNDPHLHAFQATNRVAIPASASYLDRPMLPSLSVFQHSKRPEPAPSSSCTTDGQGGHGWPTYTPPPTGTSFTTSNTGGFSVRGSPEFSSSIPAFNAKPQSDDPYYQSGGDLDPFTYNVPLTQPSDIPSPITSYPPRHSSLDGHGMSHAVHATNYMPTQYASNGGPAVASGTDYAVACPQFGDNCNAPYH